MAPLWRSAGRVRSPLPVIRQPTIDCLRGGLLLLRLSDGSSEPEETRVTLRPAVVGQLGEPYRHGIELLGFHGVQVREVEFGFRHGVLLLVFLFVGVLIAGAIGVVLEPIGCRAATVRACVAGRAVRRVPSGAKEVLATE